MLELCFRTGELFSDILLCFSNLKFLLGQEFCFLILPFGEGFSNRGSLWRDVCFVKEPDSFPRRDDGDDVDAIKMSLLELLGDDADAMSVMKAMK